MSNKREGKREREKGEEYQKRHKTMNMMIHKSGRKE
jgi:hypothetical protein